MLRQLALATAIALGSVAAAPLLAQDAPAANAAQTPVQVVQGLGAVGPAHLGLGPQRSAHRRPLRPAEQPAAQGFVQVGAGHAGGLAVRQTGHGAADAGRDAAGRAARAAVHGAQCAAWSARAAWMT